MTTKTDWTEAEITNNLDHGSMNEVRTMLCDISGNSSEAYWRLVMETLEFAFERGWTGGREVAQRELLEAGLGMAPTEGNA
jgi:hypothetical protein